MWGMQESLLMRGMQGRIVSLWRATDPGWIICLPFVDCLLLQTPGAPKLSLLPR